MYLVETHNVHYCWNHTPQSYGSFLLAATLLKFTTHRPWEEVALTRATNIFVQEQKKKKNNLFLHIEESSALWTVTAKAKITGYWTRQAMLFCWVVSKASNRTGDNGTKLPFKLIKGCVSLMKWSAVPCMLLNKPGQGLITMMTLEPFFTISVLGNMAILYLHLLKESQFFFYLQQCNGLWSCI